MTDKYYRLSDRERKIVESLVRGMDRSELLEIARSKGVSATSAEIAALDAFLASNNLYEPDPRAPGGSHRSGNVHAKALGALSSLMFFKIPLFRPDPFVSWIWKNAATAVPAKAWWIPVVLALFGYLRLPLRWHEFANEAAASINVAGAVKYAVCVAILKVMHEFAHALAAKAAGIETRKMGVAFVVFFPRFYTDVTDAWRLADRKARALIDGAGILFELVAGGLAALLWSVTPPGPAHSIAYYIVAVTVVNTVFVNGNPFIRYDGYYLLSDWVNIDNLRAKSSAAFLGAARRWLWGIPSAPPAETGWRRRFLHFYAVASFAYRVFLYSSIIAVVYFKFTKTIGLALAAVEVYVLFLLPAHMELKRVMAFKGKKRLNVTATASIALCATLVFLIPLPWTVSVPCEFVSLRGAEITALEGGRVESVSPAADGGRIPKGEVLMTLSNPELKAELDKSVIESRKAREELRRVRSGVEASGGIRLLESRARLMEELERANRGKMDRLTLRAELPGVLHLFDWKAAPGEWVAKGETLGEIYDPGALAVVGYVPERLLKGIRRGASASAYPAGSLSGVTGKVSMVSPAPIGALSPSPVLRPFGGAVPAAMEGNGKWRPLESLYPVLVELDGDSVAGRPFLAGRGGTLEIREYRSLLGAAFKRLVAILRGGS